MEERDGGPKSGTRFCRACGAEARIVQRMPAYRRVECPVCASTSFHGREEHTRWYVELYAPEGREQLPATLGRLRVEALGAVPLERAPPPRLRTSDRELLAETCRLAPAGSTVLDWGCGSGRIAQHLHRRGRRVVGVDVSPDLVSGLRQAGLPAERTDGDRVPDLPVPRVIVMAELIEHLDDAAGLLRSLRARYPEATVVASVPSPRRWRVVTGRREEWDRPPEHLVRFSDDGLQRLFGRCGYRTRILLPAPAGQDFVPGWYKRLARLGVAGVGALRRAGVHLGEHEPLALLVLWLHAAYVRMGQLLGALHPDRWRAFGRASAESMVAVADPAEKVSRE